MISDNSLIFTAAGIIAVLILIIFLISRLRKRSKRVHAQEKVKRIEKFKDAIADDEKARVDEQAALREKLLQMSKKAFKHYTKQRGYTYQEYLDVAFGRNKKPANLFFFEIEEQRKLNHFNVTKAKLSDETIQQVSDEELQSIERKYPYGTALQLTENPTAIDILKHEIGEAAAAELKRRGLL